MYGEINGLLLPLSVVALGTGIILFWELDRHLPSWFGTPERSAWLIPVGSILGMLFLILQLVGMWRPVCAGMAVSFLLFSCLLRLRQIRGQGIQKEIVFHKLLSSPGTSFRRENINARWEEIRDRLVFFIQEKDWQQLPASALEVRSWFERFMIAPGLYSTPSDNDTLLLVDSLQLYKFLLSSDHAAAVAKFSQLLESSSTSSTNNPQTSDTLSPQPSLPETSAAEPSVDLISTNTSPRSVKRHARRKPVRKPPAEGEPQQLVLKARPPVEKTK